MRFEPSSKYCDNPELCDALDRLGAYLDSEPAAVYDAKEKRAERLTREWGAQAAEAAAAAKPAATADARFAAAIEAAGGDARELAKRTISFFLTSFDGRAIERLQRIIAEHSIEVFASVGAELAREIQAAPAKFANPLSVLAYRMKKATGAAA